MTTFAQVLVLVLDTQVLVFVLVLESEVLVLVLGTKVLVLVLGEKSLSTTLHIIIIILITVDNTNSEMTVCSVYNSCGLNLQQMLSDVKLNKGHILLSTYLYRDITYHMDLVLPVC